MSYKWKSLVIYILFFVFLVCMFTQKHSFHVDELWSYGLANYEGNPVMEVIDGKKYEDPEEPFLNYLAVKEDQRFDYSKVWENQRNDNHPVLFYVILHTISSFFPGKFSLWFGAVINIAFALVLLLYLRKLLMLLTHSRRVQTIASIAFLVTYGIVNSLFFVRMYVMVMALQTMLAYLVLLLLEKELENPIPEDLQDHPKWFCYFSIAAVTYFSALTHYYCIVYAVFLSFAAFLYLLLRKLWKPALTLLGVQLAAGGLALATFPAMLERVFGGDRGAQSMDRLESFDGFDENRFNLFFGFIDKELFGDLLLFIAILLVFFLALFVVQRRKEKTDTFTLVYYLILLVPVAVYFVVIMVTAPLRVSRYLYPVYPIIFVMAFASLGMTMERVLKDRQKLAAALLAVIMCVTVGFSYIGVSDVTQRRFLEYLYPEAPTYLEKAAEYSDYDCLYIYRYPHDLMTSYMEVRQYKSITFVPAQKMEMLKDLDVASNDKLIVRTVEVGNWDYALNKILATCPQFTRVEKLFEYSPNGITSVLS